MILFVLLVILLVSVHTAVRQLEVRVVVIIFEVILWVREVRTNCSPGNRTVSKLESFSIIFSTEIVLRNDTHTEGLTTYLPNRDFIGKILLKI